MLLFLSTLSLPIILGLISYIFYKNKITNNELLALFGVSLFSFAIMFFSMRMYNVDDTHYHSTKITSLRYYEEWNEWITRTCSRTNCTGSGKTRHCHTTYYDCSYCKNHSAYWAKIEPNGSEHDISKSEYERILKLWGGERQFVDMERNYYTKDGDAYQTNWDKNILTTEIVNKSSSYENRTLTANTLFNHKPFKPEEVKSKGLINYPSTNIDNPILNTTVEDGIRRKYNNLNTNSQDYRIYFIYFKNKDRKTAFEQRRHWQGGNDNELVICVGTDANNKVIWVEPFSWCKKPIVETKVKSFFASTGGLDLNELHPQLEQWMAKDWKKRDFHDFDYIDIELSTTQVIWIWIILSIICVGFTIYIIKNEFER